VADGDADADGEGVALVLALARGAFEFALFESTLQAVETRNTDKIKISRETLMLLTPLPGLEQQAFPRFLF